MASTARQNELVTLQSEIEREISRDAPEIAMGVFGDNKNHPDMAQVSNQRLDEIYRQAFTTEDREFLQKEAQRDPEQFLKVSERIGVRMPDPNAPPPPPMPAPMAPPPPVALPAPVPPPVPVMAPPVRAAVVPAGPGIAVPPFSIPPPPVQGGPVPPQLVGPNGMPLA